VLHNESKPLHSDICGPQRNNRLCGECSPGNSTYHSSWKHTCGSEKFCHLGWLFFILSELLPLTVFFIVVVLVLNISLTTGNANCFVLYGQLLGSLAIPGEDRIYSVIEDIVTFPYNSFGLNFFTLESILLSLGRYHFYGCDDDELPHCWMCTRSYSDYYSHH
jgi:hypothetical protein